ncbi:MAG: DUF5696 domain-containing protein [Acholeplasmataceae bacterium]|jgi:hypothetical protein|nr:DUF5696 domain-containing protein [Acholeplasmataceae bacterium]
MRVSKKLFILVLLVFVTTMTVRGQYQESNKDTKMPPASMSYAVERPNEMEPIYEAGDLEFFYNESIDVFTIFDKRNNYTWTTGLSMPFNTQIDDQCDAILDVDPRPSDEEILAVCVPKQTNLSAPFEAFAKSFLTVEYFDNSFGIIRAASTSFVTIQQATTSTLFVDDNDPSHFRLDVDYNIVGNFPVSFSISVHIYFSESGMRVEVKHDEITGPNIDRIAAIVIAPYLGATGGRVVEFNLETDRYKPLSQAIDNPLAPGYIMVPDGSGALIRFDEYATTLSAYRGQVYGNDANQRQYFENVESSFVPLKQPVMPIYGVAHGNQQAAFIAYATKGESFMEIVATPKSTGTGVKYFNAHSRFVKNSVFWQIFNRSGQGYFTVNDELFDYDIELNFDFLAGGGPTAEYPADYVGMAKKYRDILHEKDQLNVNTKAYDHMPMRVDFIMSDAMNSLVGYRDVVTTNIHQVEDILTELQNEGVHSINSGLYGYQQGGISLGDKHSPNWSNSIGSAKEFERTFKRLSELGIDASLAMDYARINDEQMSLTNRASKHLNGWYSRLILMNDNGPVDVIFYAKPAKVVEWMVKNFFTTYHLDALSYTYEGVSDLLYSDYSNGELGKEDVMDRYASTLSRISDFTDINAVNPNQYLWHVVDRYLQAPMYNSQHLIETDTVPFLQLVLSGSMEVYATYANFSFYTQNDILRMIDYNTFPSFVLTNDPSFELISTNSSNFYSTEYTLYADLILDMYTYMNDAFKYVMGSEWTNRTVLAPGVILNTYENGVSLLINYTDDAYVYAGQTVDSVDYLVLN